MNLTELRSLVNSPSTPSSYNRTTLNYWIDWLHCYDQHESPMKFSHVADFYRFTDEMENIIGDSIEELITNFTVTEEEEE